MSGHRTRLKFGQSVGILFVEPAAKLLNVSKPAHRFGGAFRSFWQYHFSS
jgi:hypothetical protein